MPQVHFGMDPEFSMKDGSKPVPVKRLGLMMRRISTYVSDHLAKIVKKISACQLKF